MEIRKLLYSMGEVAEMFDVNPSLIRYWETQFDVLKPKKNRKGNRLFTPEDVRTLKVIYHLVKERGMTLEGAKKSLKQNRGAADRDSELLERLQRIRALLVEVREDLKAGAGELLVDDVPESAPAEPAAEAPAPESAPRAKRRRKREVPDPDFAVAEGRDGETAPVPAGADSETGAPADGAADAGSVPETAAGTVPGSVADGPAGESAVEAVDESAAGAPAEPAADGTADGPFSGPESDRIGEDSAAGHSGEPAPSLFVLAEEPVRAAEPLFAESPAEENLAEENPAEEPQARTKRRRGRKEADAQEKELFAFYEQTLFQNHED